jgi:hypothetical protein
MHLTALDLFFLLAVPAAVAVVGTLLWRLAMRRVGRASVPPAPAPRAHRHGLRPRPAPPAPVRLAVHANGEAVPVSQRSRR